jgi:hypothetical protein
MQFPVYICFELPGSAVRCCQVLSTRSKFGFTVLQSRQKERLGSLLWGAHSVLGIDQLHVQLWATHLDNSINFTVLDMGRWRDMNDGLLREVLRVSPNLTVLRGKRMNWLSDATLEVCGQHCPLLTTQQLWDCPEVTNEGMQALVSRLAGKLCSVFLRECPGLCSPAVLAIAEHCPPLEQLIFLQHVSAAALLKLAESCSHLTKLDVSGSNIRDVMEAILQYSSSVRSLARCAAAAIARPPQRTR